MPTCAKERDNTLLGGQKIEVKKERETLYPTKMVSKILKRIFLSLGFRVSVYYSYIFLKIQLYGLYLFLKM